MAATTKLIIYNEALRELGSHPLADLVATNTRLFELDGAFDHAVEYTLSRIEWNFARRRTILTGVADTSFPPFTYRYSKPSDYLRKRWLRKEADDEFQIEHDEIASVLYGHESSVLLEYTSDHAENYDPANWPPHFTRIMSVYLAIQVGPKIARAGDSEIQTLYRELEITKTEAVNIEAVPTSSAVIPENRLPIMRRAMEMLGEQLRGSIAINHYADVLRWAMNKSWDHSLKYILSQGAWDYASKRVLYRQPEDGDQNIPSDTIAGIIEGYSVGPAVEEAAPSISGYEYSFRLPDDFLHKIWIKSNVHHDLECDHQRLGGYLFMNTDRAVMEYVAFDDYSSDPDNWPVMFTDAFASYLAWSAAPTLAIEASRSKSRVDEGRLKLDVERLHKIKLRMAKNHDAIQQQALTPPVGRFVRARMGNNNIGRLRGYR